MLNYVCGKIKGVCECVSVLLCVLCVVVENFEVSVDVTYALSLTYYLN